MSALRPPDVTQVLKDAGRGDAAAADRLFSHVYGELRKLAGHLLRRERAQHTLQPTALVHEAYVRLVDQAQVDWQGRTHFCAVAACAMRRILVDHTRRRQARKRGGGWRNVTLAEDVAIAPERDLDVAALDEALVKLSRTGPRLGRVVELRFFGGLTNVETAEILRVSERTVEDDWRLARAWLRRELSPKACEGRPHPGWP